MTFVNCNLLQLQNCIDYSARTFFHVTDWINKSRTRGLIFNWYRLRKFMSKYLYSFMFIQSILCTYIIRTCLISNFFLSHYGWRNNILHQNITFLKMDERTSSSCTVIYSSSFFYKKDEILEICNNLKNVWYSINLMLLDPIANDMQYWWILCISCLWNALFLFFHLSDDISIK